MVGWLDQRIVEDGRILRPVLQVCLGKEGQQGPRLSCTQEGEVVCQAGWQVECCTMHNLTTLLHFSTALH